MCFSNRKITPNAIVFGVNHHNTLGILRSLGEVGIRSDLILIVTDDSDPYVAKCRYIDNCVCVSNEQEGLDILRRWALADSGGYRRVVFPTYDSVCEILDRYYDELVRYLHLPSCQRKGGILSFYLDKEIMRKTAEDVGFKTPQTYQLDSSRGIDLPKDLEYPCMIKNMRSVIGGKDLTIYHDRETLLKGIVEMSKYSTQIQIQHFVEKDKEIQLLGASFGKGHNLIACVLDKIRQYPLNTGNTCYAYLSPSIEEYIDVDKVNEFLDILDYRGLFSIEFIIRDNECYFLEINLRNDGNGYAPMIGGVNIPYLYYKSMSDQLPFKPQRICRGYHLYVEGNDLANIKEGAVSFIQAIQEYLGSKSKLYWNITDIKPFIVFGLYMIKRKVTRFFKKI